jgi:hypothetical protein
MGTLAISLPRYSPAWCIFVMGFSVVAVALFALCFICGEAFALRLIALGSGQ